MSSNQLIILDFRNISSRSLLANRIVRIDQEVKVIHNLIEMIDKKNGGT